MRPAAHPRPPRSVCAVAAYAVMAVTTFVAPLATPGPSSVAHAGSGGDAPPAEEELLRRRLDDEPIEIRGLVLATTGETRMVRIGELIRASTAMTLSATDPGSGDAEMITTTVDVEVPLCPDESGRFDGTIDYSVRGSSTTSPISSRLSVVGEVSGQLNDDARLASVALPRFDLEIRNDSTRDPDLVIEASTNEFREADDAQVAGTIVSNTGQAKGEPKDLLLYLTFVAAQYAESTLEAVAKMAGEGACVRLALDGRGITTVGPGVTAPLDVRVEEVASGAQLDLPVDASTIDGEVTPEGPVPSPAELEFTASTAQKSSYSVIVSTRSRRGADTQEYVWSTGWAFEGAVLTQQFDGFSGVSTWSGFVCGDPLTTPWTFTQTVTGPGTSYEHTFTVVPFAVGGPRPDIGTVPMIEPSRVQATADRPPFNLYLDDIAPEEASPATQRIPVAVRPATTECTAS